MMQCGWGSSTLVYYATVVLLSSLVTQTTAQQNCKNGSADILEIAATPGTQRNLSCMIPSELSEPNYVWRWFNDSSLDEELPLTDYVSTSELSVYTLNINCSHNGLIYTALYFHEGVHGCVYSCLFVVSVEENRSSVLMDEFERYSSQPATEEVPSSPSASTSNRTFPAATADISMGICSDTFYLVSQCVVAVNATWYKDGSELDINDSLYRVSSVGELQIRSLSAESVGYYVCVTELPLGLRRYRTVDCYVGLSEPTPNPTPTHITTPPGDEEGDGEDTVIFGLRVWEVGLILANVVVVVLLVGCVCMIFMCLLLRQRGSRGEEEGDHKKLVQEEIEMDTVDFYGGVPEIPFNAILFEELLHKGTFKVVHHATVTHPPLGIVGVSAAVKRLKDEKSELGMEELMSEIYILRAIQDKASPHPNIISLLGVTTQGAPTCLLLEYMPHGFLARFLWSLKKGPIPEWYLHFARNTMRGAYHQRVAEDLMSVLRQVAEGMRFLTEHGFIHRDLSTRNILVGDRLQVKIANPGMYHEGYYYMVTEREHFLHDVAPECLWERRYSIWSDVWSFGILTYKVVTLESNPYPGIPGRELFDAIAAGQRPQLLASFSNDLYFMLQRCWQFIPTERPTFDAIVAQLNYLAENGTQHIILKASKDEFTPGFVSENGQVIVRSPPPHALDPNNRGTRYSGTQRSKVSSMDDTIYSRETDETIVYMQSEADYEQYSQDEFEGVARETTEWIQSVKGRSEGIPNGIQMPLVRREEDKDSGDDTSSVSSSEESENDHDQLESKEGLQHSLIQGDSSSKT